MPNQTGMKLITFVCDAQSHLYTEIIQQPVLAWLIDLDYDPQEERWTPMATPIIAEDLPDIWCLWHPEDGFFMPNDSSCLKESDAVQWANEREQRRRELVARRQAKTG